MEFTYLQSGLPSIAGGCEDFRISTDILITSLGLRRIAQLPESWHLAND